MTHTPAPSQSNTSEVEALCARRGSQWLTQESLNAHLAAALRLESVGLLLGAGASRDPVGGLTMKEVWKRFQSRCGSSLDWLRSERFIASEETVDVEKLIDELEITRLEWKRVGRPRKLAKLTRARGDLHRAVIDAALLQRSWWESPSSVDREGSPLSSHQKVLRKVTSARQPGQSSPWIFTTNYDIAVEWAAESIGLKVTNGFDGLHRRVFLPHNFDLGYRNVLARGEARFGTYNVYLAKLHGSLTWRAAADGTVEEVSASHRWREIEGFLAGNLDELDGILVYPSAAKYSQTVGFVFGELFRRFTEFLARPQTCLIANGYSFSDEHINRILASALQNPTLQLVLCIPRARREADELVVDDDDSWLKRLVGLELPQVTVVGGRPHACFGGLVKNLPDPAIYDEQAGEILEFIEKNRRLAGAPAAKPGGNA